MNAYAKDFFARISSKDGPIDLTWKWYQVRRYMHCSFKISNCNIT